MRGRTIHTTIHQNIIFDKKRAEMGAKGVDSRKVMAEVEVEVEAEGGAAVAVVVWQIRGQQ